MGLKGTRFIPQTSSLWHRAGSFTHETSFPPIHIRVWWTPQVCRGTNSSQNWSGNWSMRWRKLAPSHMAARDQARLQSGIQCLGWWTKQVTPGTGGSWNASLRGSTCSEPKLSAPQTSLRRTTAAEFLPCSWRWWAQDFGKHTGGPFQPEPSQK